MQAGINTWEIYLLYTLTYSIINFNRESYSKDYESIIKLTETNGFFLKGVEISGHIYPWDNEVYLLGIL